MRRLRLLSVPVLACLLTALSAETPSMDRIEAVVSSRIPEDLQRPKSLKQGMQDMATALGIRLEEDALLTTSITRREIAHQAEVELARLSEMFSGPELRRRQAESWRAILARQVDQALLVQAAIIAGFTVDDDEIRSQVRQHLSDLRIPDEAHLSERLEAQGMTLTELKRDYRAQLLSKRYLDQVLKPSTPPGPREMLKYYADHIAEFATPLEAQLRQIVLPKSPDRQAAEARAREILAALQAGGDFGELARKHSKSPSAEDGGLMPYLPVTSLREDLQKLVRECPTGRDCTAQETAEAFLIIRVDGIRQGHPRPSDEVQDEILARMRKGDQEDRRARAVQLLRLRASVRTADDDAP